MLDLSYYMFFIIASKYYNKKDVVNFVVTSIKHYFHISCLSPWRLLVGQVNHNYLHQYKHYWWAYTQTWRQGLSSIYSSGPVYCTAPFVCTNKSFGRSSEWICFNFFSGLSIYIPRYIVLTFCNDMSSCSMSGFIFTPTFGQFCMIWLLNI